jgi:hypothetical protein
MREQLAIEVSQRPSSPLALLMARILAEDSHHALASNYLTFGTDWLDG